MEFTLTDFDLIYMGQLKEGICFPYCFGDLCGGWTQDTFMQVLFKLTKGGKEPIQLWYSNSEEMSAISNKKAVLDQVFSLFNIHEGRIDTLNMIAAVLLTARGKFT